MQGEEVDSDEDQSSDEASAVGLDDQAAAQEQPARKASRAAFRPTLWRHVTPRCSRRAQPGHQLLGCRGSAQKVTKALVTLAAAHTSRASRIRLISTCSRRRTAISTGWLGLAGCSLMLSRLVSRWFRAAVSHGLAVVSGIARFRTSQGVSPIYYRMVLQGIARYRDGFAGYRESYFTVETGYMTHEISGQSNLCALWRVAVPCRVCAGGPRAAEVYRGGEEELCIVYAVSFIAYQALART